MAYFVSFEGIEGSGKSTQARRLAEVLRSRGEDVVLTREPGGTEVTAQIRSLLADPANSFDPLAELLLFLADRAQHVSTVIRPALETGRVVLCDRYCDSTFAYQGFGRGHDLAWLENLNRRASHGLMPDLTIWIDCSVETGLGRAQRRAGGPGDRFEIEPLDFHSRIRAGFAELAKRSPERIVRIDGDRGEEDVASSCVAVLDDFLAKRTRGAAAAASASRPRP